MTETCLEWKNKNICGVCGNGFDKEGQCVFCQSDKPLSNGWYDVNSEFYLTKTALKKEFHLRVKELESLICDYSNLRKFIKFNRHNIKGFFVYNLNDAKLLVEDIRSESD